jgi:hypothetical protein
MLGIETFYECIQNFVTKDLREENTITVPIIVITKNKIKKRRKHKK